MLKSVGIDCVSNLASSFFSQAMVIALSSRCLLSNEAISRGVACMEHWIEDKPLIGEGHYKDSQATFSQQRLIGQA